MAPHLEACGMTVINTEHAVGDTKSCNAQKAHALLREHPERYDEVADEKGEICEKEVICGVKTGCNVIENDKRDAAVETSRS